MTIVLQACSEKLSLLTRILKSCPEPMDYCLSDPLESASTSEGKHSVFGLLHRMRFLPPRLLWSLPWDPFPRLIVYSPTFIDLSDIPNVDLSIVEGGIRTDEDLQYIREVRAKSRMLVALGLCATHGGITSLDNVHSLKKLLEKEYHVVDTNSLSARASHTYDIIARHPASNSLSGISSLIRCIYAVASTSPLTTSSGHC